jgi:hypothetical protein
MAKNVPIRIADLAVRVALSAEAVLSAVAAVPLAVAPRRTSTG